VDVVTVGKVPSTWFDTIIGDVVVGAVVVAVVAVVVVVAVAGPGI